MRTNFSSHNGGVHNTAVVQRDGATDERPGAPAGHVSGPRGRAGKPAAVGGQLGRVVSALDQVGWNHHRVPAAERIVT